MSLLNHFILVLTTASLVACSAASSDSVDDTESSNKATGSTESLEQSTLAAKSSVSRQFSCPGWVYDTRCVQGTQWCRWVHVGSNCVIDQMPPPWNKKCERCSN